MSGGSYDYAYSRIDQHGRWASILDDMAGRIRRWAGEKASYYDYNAKKELPVTDEIRGRLVREAIRLEDAADEVRRAHDALKGVEDLMHDVEWIASGDSSIGALLDGRHDEEA